MHNEKLQLFDAIDLYLQRLESKVKEGVKRLSELGEAVKATDGNPQDLIGLMMLYGSPCAVEKAARLYVDVSVKLRKLRYESIKKEWRDDDGEPHMDPVKLRDLSSSTCTVDDIETLAVAIERNDHNLFFDTLVAITGNKKASHLFTKEIIGKAPRKAPRK